MSAKTTRRTLRTSRWSVLGTAAAVTVALAAGPAYAPPKDLTDNRISNAIVHELTGARGVSANAVDVRVAKGVATLSGTVSSILAKERAARIASMTKGVRSVVNRIEVGASGRTDRQIRSDALTALATDPATESWEIDARVSDGMVTLTGNVESWTEKQLAAKVAKSVRGVRALTNNIDVTYVTERPDDEIRDEIQERLAWDARLDDELIDVMVDDGMVTLSGAVGSDYERTQAIVNAWTTGVTSVNADDLEVEWWSRDQMQRQTAWLDLDDGEIRKAVKDAFLHDPRVYSFNPKVAVDNGVVTLTGTVNNLKAKQAAAQDAANTVGVLRVKNYLKVRPETRSDEKIEKAIANALKRDAITERQEITVSVYDGEAHLYGTVDSYFERSQAKDVAARVMGVTDVHNHLTVDYDVPTYSYRYYYDWDPILYDYDFDYVTEHVMPDHEIRDDIENELFWSPFVDSDEVTVTVDDGVATLSGTVDTWSERRAATENAIEGGATRVINRLDVKY